MSEPLTDRLRAGAGDDWTGAVSHPFTQRLGDGTLDERVFATYLTQDYAFVDALVSLVGYGVAQAPTYAAKQRLSGFLGTITDEESDYFERSFDALGVPESEWRDPEPAPVTRAFADLIYRAGARGGYAETLAVLVPVEWIYAEWAGAAPESRPGEFYFAEWIDLHDNPAFHDTVAWLRGQLDEAGQSLGPRREAEVRRLFERAVELEVAFFDDAFARAGVSIHG